MGSEHEAGDKDADTGNDELMEDNVALLAEM